MPAAARGFRDADRRGGGRRVGGVALRPGRGAGRAVRDGGGRASTRRRCASIDWVGVFEQAAWALVEERRRLRATDAGVGGSWVTGDDVAGRDRSWVGRSRSPRSAIRPAFVLAGKDYDPIVGEPGTRDGLIGGGVDGAAAVDGAVRSSPACALEPRWRAAAVHRRVGAAAGGRRRGTRSAPCARAGAPPDVVDFARLLDFSRSTYDDDRTLIAVWGPTGRVVERAR